MVAFSRQRRDQNIKKMVAQRKRKAALAPRAKKKAKPGTKADNTVKVSELDLPTRAINSLKAEGLNTKGQVRRYLKDHGTVEKVKGIGKAWAQLINKLIKLHRT